LVDPFNALKQPEKVGLALDDHASVFGFDQRRVANELDCVAEAALGMKQNRSPVQLVAAPDRLIEMPINRGIVLSQPPFIFADAALQIAATQQSVCEIQVRLEGVGV